MISVIFIKLGQAEILNVNDISIDHRNFVPSNLLYPVTSRRSLVEQVNNHSIYQSLTKILNQIKSQLERNNRFSSPRWDNDPITLINDKKPPTNGISLNILKVGGAANLENNTVATYEVNSRPIYNEKDQDPEGEYRKDASLNTMNRVKAEKSVSALPSNKNQIQTISDSSTTTSLPPVRLSRLIGLSTLSPRIRLRSSTRRSSPLEDSGQIAEESIDDENEPINTRLLNEHLTSNSKDDKNGLFRLASPSSNLVDSVSKYNVNSNKIPLFLASSGGDQQQTSADSSILNQGNTNRDEDYSNDYVRTNTMSELATNPYYRRLGQNLPGQQLSSSQANNYKTNRPVKSLSSSQNFEDSNNAYQSDLVDDSMRLNSQLNSKLSIDTNDRRSISPIEMNPKSIHLQQVYNPAHYVDRPVANKHVQSLTPWHEQDNVGPVISDLMSSSGPTATLYGTRDPSTGRTNLQHIPQVEISRHAQQTSIHTQRDLLNQPQTIQITAVPNNGLVNGLTNQLIRINALGPNNNLLANGFNNMWNNGYMDPFGRQMMMVNAERRQIDWSFWIWPLIAVVTLPIILGALFVPVFLKTIVVLIQILQSLGLLLPIASALSQQLAQATGTTGIAASSTAAMASNNQLEHASQKAVTT